MEMELVQAAGRGDVTRLNSLLQHGAPANSWWNGHTSLVLAALNNRDQCVIALLESGADVDITDELGITALGHVARLGHVPCILPLLRASVLKDFQRRFESTKPWNTKLLHELRNQRFDDVNEMLLICNASSEQSLKEDFLQLILFLLISHNCPSTTLSIILDLGAHINVNYRYGLTPLIIATTSGIVEQMDVLLQKGANENLHDELCHMTPLLYAAKMGNLSCMELLLQSGPRISDRDSKGRNALMHAAQSGNEKCVALLLKNGYNISDVSNSGMTVLMYSACSGNASCMERLLTEGSEMYEVDKEGKSSLIYAAEKGQLDCLNLLTAKGCKVDEHDTWEKSALMYAAENGQFSCVELLMTLGTDVHHIDASGKTALHFAAETGCVRCVELILKYGNDVNVKDGMGVTAIMLSSLCGSVECVELLLIHGATANGADSMAGRTALMFAARQGSPGCMRLLFEYGANQHAVDNFGRTVLMYAAEGGDTECIDLFLGMDADVYPTSQRGKEEPMDNRSESVALKSPDDRSCLEKRIARSSISMNYVNCVDFRGMSGLMLATRQGERMAMKRLLDAGADVSITSFSGETALSTAIYSENSASVELLLDTEYYRKASTKESADCIKMAVRSSSPTIIAKLVQKGMFRWDWFDNADIDFVKSVYPLVIDAGYLPGDFKANGHGVTLLGFSFLHHERDLTTRLLDLVYLSDKDLVSHLQDTGFHTAAMMIMQSSEEQSIPSDRLLPIMSWPLTLTTLSLVAISRVIGSHDHHTPRDERIDALPLPPMLKRRLQYKK